MKNVRLHLFYAKFWQNVAEKTIVKRVFFNHNLNKYKRKWDNREQETKGGVNSKLLRTYTFYIYMSLRVICE
jgi:hypothetical protein